MEQNDLMPNCRQCPSAGFEMAQVKPARFMGICHIKHCTLDPIFPVGSIRDSRHISKSNMGSVVFEPLQNCPHVIKLQAAGLIPWAVFTIDYSK
jgi:hypothetical protein